MLKIPLGKSKHIFDAVFCSVRFWLPCRLIYYKWTIYGKYDAVDHSTRYFFFFWNVVESKLKHFPSSLTENHTWSLNLVHRGKIFIIWIASDIILWIESINLSVRSLGGPMVVIIPEKKWVFLLGCADMLSPCKNDRWVSRYKRRCPKKN